MNNQQQALERIQEQSGGQVHDQVVGTFSREKIYSETLSSGNDEPVYLFYDYCYTRVPGNHNANHKELVQKHFPDGRVVLVTDYPIKRFPLAWDAFLKGEDLRPEGTALEDCEAVPKERIAGLKAAHIKTVEELASLPDRSLQRIGMDARALQRAAQEWLNEHDEQARIAADLADTKAMVETLKVQLANAERGTDGDNEDDPPKRSRKRGDNSPG